MNVIAIAIIRRPLDGCYLIGQRPSTFDCPLRWEFPGGKCEGTESAREALRRELKEELGIDAIIGRDLLTCPDMNAPQERVLHFMLVEKWKGEPSIQPNEILEHLELRWVLADVIRQFHRAEIPTVAMQYAMEVAEHIPVGG